MAALSPIHVHYSQELRPYSLALLLMALALWLFDRALESGALRHWALLALALAACLYTLYFSGAILVVLLVLALEEAFARDPARRRAGRAALKRGPLLAAAVALAYLPWADVALGMHDHRLSRQILGAESWSLGALLQRWHHLTVGGFEGDPPDGRLWLPLVLAAVGLVAALGLRGGRAVVAGALAGTLGVELLLQWTDHWTNTRYNLTGWPFLCLLIAIGLVRLGSIRRLGPAGRVVTALLLLAQLALQVPGLRRYYDRGRPDWRWVADAVAAVAAPEDTVIAANAHTLTCLGYYRERRPGGDYALLPYHEGATPEALRRHAGCAYLVAGGWPPPAPVIRALSPQAKLLTEPATQGIRLYRLTPYDGDRDCTWVVPRHLRWRPDRGLLGLGAPAAPEELTLEFEHFATPVHLLEGWLRFEVNAAGTSFVWAVGEKAVMALGGLEPVDRQLRLDLWTLATPGGPQRMEVELNGTLLERLALPPGAGSVELAVPARIWRSRENLLVFRFALSVVPAELDPASGDNRQLAVAFDRLVVRRAGEASRR